MVSSLWFSTRTENPSIQFLSVPLYLFLMRCTLLLVLLLTCCRAAYAQESPWTGVGIENNEIVGKVFKHTPKFILPIPSVSTAAELNIVFKTHGTKEWQQRRRFPVLGIAFTYTNYGIDSIYGRGFGIIPNFEIPIVTGKRLEWTLRLGFGLGYLTKRYERAPVLDTLNDAIGSHINNFTTFTTDLRYHLNKYWDIQLGANFSHMSDASFRQPNLGINMYGAHIGFRYFPEGSNPKHTLRELKPLKNRWLFEARASLAMQSYGAPGGPLFPIYLTEAFVSKRWLSKNKVYAGFDYTYYTSIYAFLRNNEILPGQEAQNSYKAAVFLGNEFLMGHFGLVLQLGYYVKNAYLHAPAPYYEKIGVNYYLLQQEHGVLKELYLSVLLKAHSTVAELVSGGIGVGF